MLLSSLKGLVQKNYKRFLGLNLLFYFLGAESRFVAVVLKKKDVKKGVVKYIPFYKFGRTKYVKNFNTAL